MAQTTTQENNKLVKFVKDINREYVRSNMFSPYMGDGMDAIIRLKHELKPGGEQMNIPLVTRLRGKGKGPGTLVGNEEKIDNYGMRVWVDWARNAITVNKAEKQKSSVDLLGERKPLLSEWGRELQRDEIIEGFMALPSESAPVGLGSDDGQRVNGILYESATAAERNTWNAANSDRVLYGTAVANYNATHATALANIDTTNDRLDRGIVELAKRRALIASPAIKPYMDNKGYSSYVMFVGPNGFRDLKSDLASVNQEALAREGKNNVIYQDGDLFWDGIVIRQVPEMSLYVENVWTSLLTAGNSSSRVEPYFLCGQQAMAFAWGQMAQPTERKEDDYGFISGAGVEMCYGVAKMFKKHPMDGSNLKQWGVLTGFVSAPADA